MAGNRGFTLLELLVALTLFALIGAGAQTMLRSVIASREATHARAERLASLQRAVWILADDLAEIEPATLQISDSGPSFIRRGWRNPLALPRGDRLQLRYQLRGHTLMRLGAEAGKPDETAQTLLENVDAFTVRPLPPRGVEFVLQLPPYGTVRRVVEVPEP